MTNPTNANVRSLDALRDVRLALIAFQERADSALGALRTRIDRTLTWLEQDRPQYWREQERNAYDRIGTARVAYDTCRLRTVGGRHPECIEEKVALQRAKARLEFCQQKQEVVRRWNIEAGRQVDDYRGRSSPLRQLLDEDVPNVLAMLARMIDAIEAYAVVESMSDEVARVQLSAFVSGVPDAVDVTRTREPDKGTRRHGDTGKGQEEVTEAFDPHPHDPYDSHGEETHRGTGQPD